MRPLGFLTCGTIALALALSTIFYILLRDTDTEQILSAARSGGGGAFIEETNAMDAEPAPNKKEKHASIENMYEESEARSKIEGQQSDNRPSPTLFPSQLSLFDVPGYPRPKLKTLVSDNSKGVVSDVSWLLDFAIVGHSKTGTTGQMNWLASHEEIAMYQHELHSLGNGRPAELVKSLYRLPRGMELKRGYKSPHELQRRQAVRFYQQYWPRTKLIVGLRHPILWFQSYYNFNYAAGNRLPPAETLIGDNFPGGVMFHEHLARLGKTNLTDPIEYQLLGRTKPDYEAPYMPNPVFLYEVSQPFDSNETRKLAYCQDMTDYLGLHRRLEPLVGDTDRSSHYSKLDICRPKYKKLRGELIAMGHNASTWLLKYFLHLPDVHFSSPDYFREMIASWATDPCES